MFSYLMTTYVIVSERKIVDVYNDKDDAIDYCCNTICILSENTLQWRKIKTKNINFTHWRLQCD